MWDYSILTWNVLGLQADGTRGDAVPGAVRHHAGFPVDLLGVQLRESAANLPAAISI